MQSSSRASWSDVIKKEAKGMNDFSFGEVHSVEPEFVYTEKGTISKHRYYLPKYLVRGFDGHTVWFNISESRAESEFKRDSPPNADEYVKYRPTTVVVETDSIPLI
jgi:hypothetical protein